MLTNKRDALVSLQPIKLLNMCERFTHTQGRMSKEQVISEFVHVHTTLLLMTFDQKFYFVSYFQPN
jgi:hypothetical protein